MPGISIMLQNGSTIDAPGQWVFQVNTSAISSPPVLIGDVNNDNISDAVDAGLVLQVLVGITPTTAIYFASAGDVNADGVINSGDSILILAIAAGRIPPPRSEPYSGA
jgi:hypothetical protein